MGFLRGKTDLADPCDRRLKGRMPAQNTVAARKLGASTLQTTATSAAVFPFLELRLCDVDCSGSGWEIPCGCVPASRVSSVAAPRSGATSTS